MANVTNTSQVNNYQYNITTGILANGSSNTSVIAIDVTAASVTFTKSNNPQYIDLGGTSTITYTIKNNNLEPLTIATIPTGQFMDSWTANGLTNVQINTPDFQVSNNEIMNTTPIIINAGATLTIIITANAAVPY